MSPLVLGALAVAAVGVFVALAYRRGWHWTGLPAAAAATAGAEDRPAKTLWDWLQLLGIPVALAALAFWLNDAQGARDQRREDDRAAHQRAVATDVERENTLRTYLAQMSDLILDRRLLRSPRGADVREVGRTATLTAVRRLDGPRRGLVVRFLAEAGLLRSTPLATAALRISSADLHGADLFRADLNATDLAAVDLSEANLHRAHLFQARLSRADLSRANLSGADLTGAGLPLAYLAGANLALAQLRGANLRGANLSRADLHNADLHGADIHRADLTDAGLSRADLHGVDLHMADLTDADLSHADLHGADLRDTTSTGRTSTVPTSAA